MFLFYKTRWHGCLLYEAILFYRMSDYEHRSPMLIVMLTGSASVRLVRSSDELLAHLF
jgi:hypothetical protein